MEQEQTTVTVKTVKGKKIAKEKEFPFFEHDIEENEDHELPEDGDRPIQDFDTGAVMAEYEDRDGKVPELTGKEIWKLWPKRDQA